ncbi:MAG: hypothetical protein LBR18_01595 [Tannerella sp.]|jgi:hypothetical protein|nr:hypothetical protein [Tannerella sp.]
MSEFRYFTVAYDKLGVSMDEALDMIREDDRTRNNPVFCDVEYIFGMLPELCEIRGGYTVLEPVDINAKEGFIRWENNDIPAGRKVCVYMKHASKLAVFIGSAGEKFTTLSKQYNREGDYLKGYVIDTFGSIIAEKMAEFVQNAVEEDMTQEGLKITNRYSPGYCNWHLSGQKQLFSLIPENPCNISLTDSMLMMPIKSVSGIIGIGENVVKREYACAVCEDKNCPYRKVLNDNQQFI